ncbi:MAG: hypothetical protein ABSC65_18700 [Acidobacteriaceae bacterium]|jgi:hypothetical protein
MRIAQASTAVMLAWFCICNFAETPPQKITLRGTLTRVMAIGGESTGWTIQLDSETTIDGKPVSSIQVHDSRQPGRLESLVDKRVRIVGKVHHRHGVEIGTQPFIEVSSIKELGGPDQWLGRWDGVEGTYLRLAKNGDKYVVEIRDLDGPKTFEGFADGNRIRFTRDGKTEFISAGNGQATGMKWLADKKNCLLTRLGEGWCRD